jgi:hypothetical protein
MNDDELGFGRKLLWPNFKVLSRNSDGGTEENHENPDSGYPVSGPSFGPSTFRIQSRNELTTRPRLFMCTSK